MDPGGIDEYIRNNRASYTDEAIRGTLVAAGHDSAEIDDAFRRLGSAAPQWDASTVGAGSSALVGLAWGLFIVGGIVGLAGFAMAASFGSGGSILVFLIAYIGIGLGIVFLLRWAVPRLGISGIWAGLLGLVLFPVFGGLMFGTCFAAFNVMRV